MDRRPARDDGRDFAEALKARIDDVLTNCTSCGKCVESCPMTGPAAVDTRDPKAVAAGVLRILETGRGPDQSLAWLNACTLSGACIAACGEGINPRFMVVMARIGLKRAENETIALKKAGAQAFAKVRSGVRVMSRLQLPPAQLARLGQAAEADEVPDPDLIFYMGCNLLRMPHIPLLCIDVLDALGANYRVGGGPTQCCGIPHFRAGDPDTAGRIAFNTVRESQIHKVSDFLCWCGSCGRQFGEIVLPAYEKATGEKPFVASMFILYLERRLEDLRPLMIHEVHRKVGLHEHPGLAGVGRAVRNLLEVIPGLEFIDLEQPQMGAMCSDFLGTVEIKKEAHQSLLNAARDVGVTTLAGIYHACHGQLCGHQSDWPFEVVNFMELIGASMGIGHKDSFKHIKLARDTEVVIDEFRDLIDLNGLDPDEVHREVTDYIFGG